MLSVDPGFTPQNLLVAQTFPARGQYDDAGNRTVFYRGVVERVRALPGVTSAGYVNYPPLTIDSGRFRITLEDRPDPNEVVGHRANARTVSTDYLSTLGVPLLRGRGFDERDSPEAPRSVIINEAMAGIGLGLAGAVGLTRFLASFLFGVSPTDSATLGGVAVVIVIVTVCASYVPARRAAAVDPISVLRTD